MKFDYAIEVLTMQKDRLTIQSFDLQNKYHGPEYEQFIKGIIEINDSVIRHLEKAILVLKREEDMNKNDEPTISCCPQCYEEGRTTPLIFNEKACPVCGYNYQELFKKGVGE